MQCVLMCLCVAFVCYCRCAIPTRKPSFVIGGEDVVSEEVKERWDSQGRCTKECTRSDCKVRCESFNPMVSCLGERCNSSAVGDYAYSFCHYANCTAFSEGFSPYAGAIGQDAFARCFGFRCRAYCQGYNCTAKCNVRQCRTFIQQNPEGSLFGIPA